MAASGATFAYDAAVLEDIETVVPEVTTGVSVHNGIVAHYMVTYGSEGRSALAAEDGQRRVRRRHRDDRARHRLRPAGHEDHRAQDGNNYVINGQKTFITNGQAADLIIVVARTGGPGAKGLSLIVLETDGTEGFRRGLNLSTRSASMRPTRRNCFSTMRWCRRKTCSAPRKAAALRS